MRTSRAVRLLRTLALSGLVAAVVLSGSGCASRAESSAPTATETAPQTGPQKTPPTAPSTTAAAPPTAVAQVPMVDASLGAPVPASSVPPVAIAIGALELDMPVEAMGVTDEDLMELPPDTAVAGWYKFGPGVRAAQGTTVVAAHVDSNAYGLGPFARLKELESGTEIVIRDADGADNLYTVTSVTTTEKGDVPLGDVFTSSGAPRLILVTCGGDFDYDTRHYLSNVIVEAVPA